jgi:hypothetical protein
MQMALDESVMEDTMIPGKDSFTSPEENTKSLQQSQISNSPVKYLILS